MKTGTKPVISTRAARTMIEAAVAHAEELGVRVCVAVVDEGGTLKALARMDGALFMTVRIATNKAMTAAGTGVATATLAEAIAEDAALLAGLTSQEHTAIFPGGVPIIDGEAVVGAIGVSGGMAGEDHPIAEAGLSAL